jgi:MoxR-like ATPase
MPIISVDQEQQKVTSTKILNLTADQEIKLNPMPGWPAGGYRLSDKHAGAIQAAYFAKRPLLVRGDPGLGKSQLAQAIASYLDWGLVTTVIHYNSSFEDLLYSQDHLERLYDANQQTAETADDEPGGKGKLNLEKYIRPGKIWQAMAPETVEKYKTKRPHDKSGTVLLIDEIDKADSTLPNALLEVLNNGAISVPCLDKPIEQANHPYFVVITSNDERLLPQAFIRRCAVLDLHLKQDETEAIAQLTDIYKTHLKYNAALALDDSLVNQAASLVVSQRQSQSGGEYHSGTSEFLDVIKALCEFPQKSSEHLAMLATHLINKNQQRV